MTAVKIVAVTEKKDVACWPHINHDAGKEILRITTPIRENNPDMRFDVVVYDDISQARADYETDLHTYDGIVVLLLTCWKGIDVFYCKQAVNGLPVIIADIPFCGSGSALVDSSPLIRRMKLPVPLLATSDYSEIARAVRVFHVMAQLKKDRILVISNRDKLNDERNISEKWGCTFINSDSDELNRYIDAADMSEAGKTAKRWISEATGIVEPTEADIEESARLYHAIGNMMRDKGANAVTLDCLTLSYNNSYKKNTHMYPCLSHCEMLNNGTVAVCESDIGATLTSLVLFHLTGKMGFVSDPVIDTHSGNIIYAHCVACRKPYGINDTRLCRSYIRSHAEDRKGASVQVILPENEQLTTTMIYADGVSASVHSAVSVGNVGLEEGCRTKLAAHTNADTLLANWAPGWHRVTVVGDYRKELMNLYLMKGLTVYQEDRGI